MTKHFLIRVTEQQLLALQHAVAHTQGDHQRELPKRRENVDFWEKMDANEPEREKYLAMSRDNLAWTENHLALVNGVVSVICEARPEKDDQS